MGGFGGEFSEELPTNFSEVAFVWKSPDATHFGATSRSLLHNSRNFSEVAPEVRPAVHTALLCLVSAIEDTKRCSRCRKSLQLRPAIIAKSLAIAIQLLVSLRSDLLWICLGSRFGALH